MSRKSFSLEVPIIIREQLFPYADLFESVLIPSARSVSFASIGRSELKRLKREITLNLAEAGFRPHYVLVYVGLMLCCRYTELECSEIRDQKMKQKKLGLVAKVRSLVCLVYQDYVLESFAYLV